VRVLRSRLPVPEPTAETAALQEVLVDLPRLTARYEGPFEAPAAAVFEREQLELRDFKARILRRVYLTKGERPVAFAPEALTAEPPVRDDQDGEGWQMTVAFTLGAGRYATLVMKAAAALIGTEIWTR